jgi:NAD-dependent SIR2 family protein deacetylase
MAKNVFILGAGASAHAGVPLMKDFFNEAVKLLEAKDVLNAEEEQCFRTIIEAFKKTIMRIDSNYNLDPGIRNIETLFSLVDLATVTRSFAEYDLNEIQVLKSSLIRFIVSTIEKKTDIKRDHSGKFLPSNDYDNLVRLITGVKSQDKTESFSIITFNYDLALDYAIMVGTGQIDYCLAPLDDSHNALKLMKMHGSLNWIKCPNRECEGNNSIRILSLKDYCPRPGEFPFEIRKIAREKGVKCPHCQSKLMTMPVIIPPTWNKAEEPGIASVWQSAAAELSGAKNIYIIGYSLPKTDLFFHYLLALGTLNIMVLDRFWVFDPVNNVDAKYKDLLRGQIREKYRFNLVDFSRAVKQIKDFVYGHIRLPFPIG